jgi:hypothetical protein
VEGSKPGKVEIRFATHPSDDAWEEYAFGRLDESRMAPIEEHLLVCTQCQETLARLDTFIAAMKSAGPVMAALGAESVWTRWLGSPRRVAVAFGAAVLVIGMSVASALHTLRDRSSAGPLAVVALQSFRGDTVQTAPSGRPLELQLPAADATPGSTFRLEVVTASGTTVWKGDPGATRVRKGFRKGVYFVRLYDASGELLREYSLRVE